MIEGNVEGERVGEHDMQYEKDSHTDKMHMDKELTGMSVWNSRFDRS